MVTGIVLVNVQRAMLQEVVDATLKLNGVTEVYTVAGEYDLVVIVRVKTNKELSDIVAGYMTHDINGIISTKTLVSLDVHSEFDLEGFFLKN